MKVFDASVVVKVLTEEVLSADAAAAVAGEAQRIAPDILPFEVASALSKKARYAGLPRAFVDRALRGLPDLSIELTPLGSLMDAAVTLSIELQHAFYDCLYLALAEREDCAVVTADEKFARAVAASRFGPRLERLESRP